MNSSIRTEWRQEFLGMGDVLTLIDKAQETIDEKAQELEEKIRKQQFDLDDFLEQFKQIRKNGFILTNTRYVAGNR